MKIGIYDPYLNDIGGGEKYMMSLAVCLSERNTVSVFWDNPEDLALLSTRFGLNFSSVTKVKNIFSPHTSTLQRYIETRKYDAIIVLSDGSIPLVGCKKLIIHIQQPLQKMQTKSFMDKIKLARVSKFFCNSEYTKSYIGEKFSLKTSVIYPPVSLFSKKIKKENIILHVGRFRIIDPLSGAGDYKKQHMMIDTFKDLVKKGFKNWKLVLAVSVMDREKDAFEEMKKGTEGFPIEFLINKSNEQLWDAYSKAKIYWHASGFGEDLIRHPEYAEHFGISTVEAMGAGAVPVVINAGGQKEIVINNESGLFWNSEEELEKQTRMLARDVRLWERLSRNAIERAKDFSYESFCKKVNELIQ